MKTVFRLLLISLLLFVADSISACEGGEWKERIHGNHDPEDYPYHSDDGDAGGGQHRHTHWVKKCPDGTSRISSNYGPLHRSPDDVDVYKIDDALSDFVDDTPEVDFEDPGEPPSPANTPQLQGRQQEQVVQQPVITSAQDTVNNGGGEPDTQGLPPLPDVTPQNPTQDAEQPTSQAIQGQPQQTGVTPHPTPQATQPQGRQQTPVAQQPLRVTEYMVRDWSRSAGGDLPQWIELYNPNPNPILLHNCFFSYVVHQGFNKKVKHVQVDNFTVPAQKAVIFVTRAVGPNRFGGVTAEQVYALNIPNSLKSGWLLRTATGGVIFKAGEEFGGTRPHAPNHVEGNRQSFTRYAEADTETAYFYGSAWDIGTPGYHEPVRAAPSVLRKKIGLWGTLKQTE